MQGSYRSQKTWKVVEFVTSISKPGKLWNLSGGHAKLWKSNALGKKIYVTIENKNGSVRNRHACMHYNAGKYVTYTCTCTYINDCFDATVRATT